VECVIADTHIDGVAESAARVGIGLSITFTKKSKQHSGSQ